MGWIIGACILPACILAVYYCVRRPVRELFEEVHTDSARDNFRLRREWLEARFLGALYKTEPEVAALWEDAHWQNEVTWARDRKSRCLIALVGVTFNGSFDQEMVSESTAIFEFRKGRWHSEGKRLDETRPAEALIRYQRFEPVIPPRVV